MTKRLAPRGILAVLASLTFSLPGVTLAQDTAADATADRGVSAAVGTEIWASSDSDGTSVTKLLGRALWHYADREDYAGMAVEHVWFAPATGARAESNRIYLDAANRLGADWRWRARVGSDGDTIVGNAELRRADWSKSLFVEREIVETDQGLRRGIYYTFVGASADFSLGPQDTLALTTGVQNFTGTNERIHVRARYVHAIAKAPGLSAQLDSRYYHSTSPGEFDYFSPRDFARVVPIAQYRRFTKTGWMLLGAAGIGAQASTGAKWTAARFGQLRLESPRGAQKFDVFGELLYANDSLSGGTGYDYVMGRVGMTVRL